MDPLVTLFVYAQALGALVGAFSAVWGELSYVHAMRDGRVDRAERRHLDALARALRFGMTTLLLASLGLVIIAYRAQTSVPPGLTATYWAFIALALLITFLSWALSKKRISFTLGSAAIFTAWWFLAYMALGRLPALSFGAAVALYVVATGVFYFGLRLARALMRPA